jgi:hypothetical protein
MEPDSEEIRRTFEPLDKYFARVKEWIMKGGEIADVAVQEFSIHLSNAETEAYCTS